MDKTKFEQTKALGLQQTNSSELNYNRGEAVVDNKAPVKDSKSLSASLTQAQNQLGLCLQRQRQVGFILREVKDILKR